MAILAVSAVASTDKSGQVVIDSLYAEAYRHFADPSGLELSRQLFERATKEGNKKMQAKAKLIEAKYYENVLPADSLRIVARPIAKWLHDNEAYDEYYHVCIYQIMRYIRESKFMDSYQLINEMYESAVKDKSDYGIEGAYRMRGTLLQTRLAYGEAKKCYEEALKYGLKNNSPRIYSSYFSIARCEAMMGRFDDAVKHLNEGRALANTESMKVAFDVLEGVIYAMQGNDKKVVAEYDNVKEYLKTNTLDINLLEDALKLSAFYQMVKGNYGEAMTIIRQLPKQRQLEVLPEYYRRQGRYKDAFEAKTEKAYFEDSVNAKLAALDLEQFAERVKRQEVEAENKILELENEKVKRQAEKMGQIVLIAFLLLFAIALMAYVYVQKRRNKLLAAERDSRDKFIQDMSHEIRTPLHQIRGFVGFLTNTDQQLSDTDRELIVQSIDSGVDQLTSVLNNMLDLYNFERDENKPAPSEIEAAAFCRETVAAVNNHNKELAVKVDNSCNKTHTFRSINSYLRKLLLLLLDNACKFTERGVVTLGYSLEEKPGMITFYVEDMGCGIPEDKREKIFDRFEKLDTYKPGIGLGLTISRALASQLGGDVSVDGTYSGGARFVVHIPAN